MIEKESSCCIESIKTAEVVILNQLGVGSLFFVLANR